ncbi:hypothetical protein ABPG74_002844 [Tetrahymena malaccensis]
MKTQILVAIALQLLILVNADDNCTLTIDQLNNQVLKSQFSKLCKNCFTSDVKLTIQSNTKQITSLKLTAVDVNDPVQSITLQPAQSSLTISPSFLIQYQSGGTYEKFNFLTECQAMVTDNGELLCRLTFNAKVNGDYQFFTLNKGLTNNSLVLKNLSYVALIFCMILIF